MEMIEETDREGYWIRELGGCNQMTLDFDRVAYDRARYAANRETIREKQREKIPCSNCGRVVSRSRISRHKRTLRCKNMTENSQ